MKTEKMVLIGSLDPVVVVRKLKKAGQVARLETVGPANEQEKKKDEAAKKPEAKKEEGKKQEVKKLDPMVEYVNAYHARYPHYMQHYYVTSVEENPNACVIS